MKKGISLLLILIVAMATASEVPTEWKDRYHRILMLITSKNVKGFKANFSKDFTMVDPKGKQMTRAEFFKEVDGMFAMATKITGNIKLKKATMRGSMVDVAFDFRTTIHGKKGSSMVHEVGVDTWKKVGGKWMMVKTVDTTFDVTEKK